MEGWYHASIARSGPKFPQPASTDPLRAFVETLLLRDQVVLREANVNKALSFGVTFSS